MLTRVFIRVLLLAVDGATVAVMLKLHTKGTYEAGMLGAYFAVIVAAPVQAVLCIAGYAWDKGRWQRYAYASHGLASVVFLFAADSGYLR